MATTKTNSNNKTQGTHNPCTLANINNKFNALFRDWEQTNKL
jgi:hypothetical protein